MGVLSPISLAPGDRAIRAVVPDRTHLTGSGSRHRSCARCARRIDRGRAAVVVYGPYDDPEPDTAPLCPGCATALTPFRLVLDQDLLDALQVDDPAVRVVRAGVAAIAAQRAAPTGPLLLARAADVHAWAARVGTTRTHLALRLRDAGVLAGSELATDYIAGAVRRG